MFYPANFTSVASTELIQLSERVSEFRKLSTQVHIYIICYQNEVKVVVSDFNQTIVKSYNLLTNDGFPFPGVFIIDKEGIIQYFMVNNLLCGRNIDELLRILDSVQYLKENPGQACPVDWKYGNNILYSHPLKSKIYFKRLYSKK